MIVLALAFQEWNAFLGGGKRKKRWMGMRTELGPKKVLKVRIGYFSFFCFMSTSFSFCKRFQGLMDAEGEKSFLSNFLSAFFYFSAKYPSLSSVRMRLGICNPSAAKSLLKSYCKNGYGQTFTQILVV